MAFALGRSTFLVNPSTYSSSPFTKNVNKSFTKTFSPSPLLPRHDHLVARAQVRPTWLPGLDPPPYLNGSLAGDFGFDQLGLGEDPDALKWYVQAELVHCRFAMAGVAGILFTDLLRVTGISNLPVWYEAGALEFAETKRYMDFISPGSQGKEGSFFFGMEASFAGLEPGYLGGPLLNPFGLAKDIKNAHDSKLKEIKNGRLAMVGFFVQASVTHVGPIDNLVKHLSDPWHNTIIQTLN
ncbi:hypothetical protein ACFE04_016003 [Oxalis oulophora]